MTHSRKNYETRDILRLCFFYLGTELAYGKEEAKKELERFTGKIKKYSYLEYEFYIVPFLILKRFLNQESHGILSEFICATPTLKVPPRRYQFLLNDLPFELCEIAKKNAERYISKNKTKKEEILAILDPLGSKEEIKKLFDDQKKFATLTSKDKIFVNAFLYSNDTTAKQFVDHLFLSIDWNLKRKKKPQKLFTLFSLRNVTQEKFEIDSPILGYLANQF